MNDLSKFYPFEVYEEPARLKSAPTPNPAEVATIIVGGRRWDDWTNVMVEHRYAEAWPHFKFSSVERGPIQFRPGQECAIYLGGVLAIVGVITVRQVAYDANNHGVQLMGKGVTWYASKSSIIDETGDFDGQTFEQVARKVIAPFGVGVKTIGKLNDIPFQRLQIEPGEKLWDSLERLARPKGVVIGSDHLGNFLLIGEHTDPVEENLVEGVNIKSLQCLNTVEHTHSEYRVGSQSPGTDDHNGAAASQQQASVPGTAVRYSPLLTSAEQPVWDQSEVLDRARNESIWHEGSTGQASVTVQGWFRRPGQLWRAGTNVHVYSPMALLDEVMTIQSCLFSQEGGGGTTTTLECVPPFLLRGGGSFNVGAPSVAQDPASYETTLRAALPMLAVPEPPPLLMPP
jgi:prophage tail gpP-like protein